MALLAWLFTSCALLSYLTLVGALNNGQALTPPMGWNSFERFRHQFDCEDDPHNCLSEWLIKSISEPQSRLMC